MATKLEARVVEARAALANERALAEEVRKNLSAARARGSGVGDAKTLTRVATEVVGHETALRLLEEAVQKAEAAVAEAEKDVAAAKRERLRDEQLATFQRHRADRARLEEKVAAATERFFAGPEEQRDAGAGEFLAEVRQLLRELDAVWWSGLNFICSLRAGPGSTTKIQAERSRVWPSTPWPIAYADESDAHLLDRLERVVRPDQAEAKREARAWAAERAREDERIRRDYGIFPASAPPVRREPAVQDSGIGEQELARMRANRDGPRLADRGGGPARKDTARLVEREQSRSVAEVSWHDKKGQP